MDTSASASAPEKPELPPKPELPTRESGVTFAAQDSSSASEEKHDSNSSSTNEKPQKPPLNTRDTGATLVQESHRASDTAERGTPPLTYSGHPNDFVWLAAILIMLCWPWIFFGVLWGLHGIELTSHFAQVVTNNPSTTTFFITQIGSIANNIIVLLFSMAILRFAQGWMAAKDSVTVFHLSLISAFRNQKFPWGVEDREYLLARRRWLRVALVGLCIYTFTNVTSGVTSLITPVPFDQTVLLRGNEIDFGSTAPDCLAWLNANPIPNVCDWKMFNGANYTTCLGENQMVDVLDSGRGNILSLLSNNSESLSFTQLGAKDGLQFLGPIRGVLPIGPNGVPAFDTLETSPFSDPEELARMISYNYTIANQGVTSNISCKYDSQTPVKVYPVIGDSTGTALQFNGTCDGAADVLTNVISYTTMNSNNSLVFWACKSLPDAGPEPSYFIYLRGRGNYATSIGNITCTASPIQPAIFPVLYQSSPGIFGLTEPTETSANTFTGFIEQAVVALGGLVAQAQNQQANLVAESVITFGVKSFKLPPYDQDPIYLQLYEAMIQGILEYEATYTRLLYSTFDGRPSSCTREVNGSVTYTVLGWTAGPEHIGFLMPMTVINLATFVVFVIAMARRKKGRYVYDPVDPKVLALAERTGGDEAPVEAEVGKPTAKLGDRVAFPTKEMIKEKVDDPDELPT